MDGFEQIYNEYFPRVYFFLHKMCKDDILCEEMTQETFYQALISIHRYNGSCELFTWLASIAKNTYFSYLRKNKIKTVEIDLIVTGDGESQNPEKELLKTLTAHEVRSAVKKLPQKYRDVIILRIYGELPYEQIAAMLKISESSAKVIFFRAKNMLKTLIFPEYNDS